MYMKQQKKTNDRVLFVVKETCRKLSFFLSDVSRSCMVWYINFDNILISIVFICLGVENKAYFFADESRSNTVTHNYGVFIFRRAHTITVLVVFCVILVYVTLFEEKTYDADYNNKRFAVIFWFSDEYSVYEVVFKIVAKNISTFPLAF